MRFFPAIILTATAALLAACGGGGGGSSSVTPGPTPTIAGSVSQPSPGPSSAPSSVTSQPQAQAVAIPAFDGISGVVNLGSASVSGATITVASGALPPAGVTTLAGVGVRNVLAYVAVTANGAITYPGGTQVVVTVPASLSTAGLGWYLGVNTGPGTGWLYQMATGSISGTTVTFPIPNFVTLGAGTTYTVALYQG